MNAYIKKKIQNIKGAGEKNRPKQWFFNWWDYKLELLHGGYTFKTQMLIKNGLLKKKNGNLKGPNE